MLLQNRLGLIEVLLVNGVDFRDYFEQEGMNFSSIANIVYTVGKGSEEIVSTAGTLTKILKYAVPALVVGIGIFYGMKAYKELS